MNSQAPASLRPPARRPRPVRSALPPAFHVSCGRSSRTRTRGRAVEGRGLHAFPVHTIASPAFPCARTIPAASTARATQQRQPALLPAMRGARSTRRRPLPTTGGAAARPPNSTIMGARSARASGRARSSSPRRSGRPRRSRTEAAAPARSGGASMVSP